MIAKSKALLIKLYAAIARDWFAEKNGSHALAEIGWSSKVRVWWRCVNGHEYEASVYTRVRTQGCKLCRKSIHGESSRLARLKGSTSFAVAKPELVVEWQEKHNLPLTPDTTSHKSHKLVWWQCTEGHEWQSTPQRRSRGDGCPQCSRAAQGQRIRTARLKKGGISFAEAHPELLPDWDRGRNTHEPNALSPKSNVRASWVCRYGQGPGRRRA